MFIHFSHIDSDDRFKTLSSGQVVEYRVDRGPKGLHARLVRPIDDVPELILAGDSER